RHRPLPRRAQELTHPVRKEARVHHQGLLPPFQGQEPAIRVERVVVERLEIHRSAMLTAAVSPPFSGGGQFGTRRRSGDIAEARQPAVETRTGWPTPEILAERGTAGHCPVSTAISRTSRYAPSYQSCSRSRPSSTKPALRYAPTARWSSARTWRQTLRRLRWRKAYSTRTRHASWP